MFATTGTLVPQRSAAGLEGELNAEIYFLVISFNLFCHPIIGIAENLNPWSNIIGKMVGWICSTLPWEYSTLWVRHHSHVTAIRTCKSSHIVIRTVWISRITLVCILSNDVVLLGIIRKRELTLTVSNPNTKTAVRE